MFTLLRIQADVLSARNAVSSAVDVMQAMGSSICYLLSKVRFNTTCFVGSVALLLFFLLLIEPVILFLTNSLGDCIKLSDYLPK